MLQRKFQFIKNGFLSMAEQGFSSITSFVTGIIIARGTNVDVAGLYALIFSVTIIGFGLQRVLIALPFNVYYQKINDPDEKKDYLSATAGFELIFLACVILITVLLSLLKIIPLSINIWSLIFFLMGHLLKDYSRQFFYAIERVGTCIAMSSLQSIIQVILLLILFNFNSVTISRCLLIIGITNTVNATVFLMFFSSVTLRKKHLLDAWNRNRWTVKWSIGISMSDALKNQISVWMLNLFVSISAVGIYTTNNTFAMLPQTAFNGFCQYMLPNFSKSYGESDYKQIRKKFLFSILLISLCNFMWILVLIFWGNDIVKLVYGKEYVTLTIVLVLCSLRGFLASLASITSAILQAIEKPYSIFSSLVVAIISMITIGLFLTWKYQILGLSASMVLMYIITLIMQLISVKRELIKEQI